MLKDYSIAALYYTRASQWDLNTPYPALYKAANIYDRHLTNREKALELFKALPGNGSKGAGIQGAR